MYPIQNALEDYVKNCHLFEVSSNPSYIQDDANKLIGHLATLLFDEWKRAKLKLGNVPQIIEEKMKKDFGDSLYEILFKYASEECDSCRSKMTQLFNEMKVNQ